MLNGAYKIHNDDIIELYIIFSFLETLHCLIMLKTTASPILDSKPIQFHLLSLKIEHNVPGFNLEM